MPSVDSKTGKRLGGAAIKRKKIETQREEVAREEVRKSVPKSKGLSFDDLPLPDLDSSDEAVTWWNKVLLVCADQVIRDPAMPLEKKIKFLLDGAGKAGMIRDKAKEQDKIKKIFQAQNKERTTLGLQDASQFPAPTISRPPG